MNSFVKGARELVTRERNRQTKTHFGLAASGRVVDWSDSVDMVAAMPPQRSVDHEERERRIRIIRSQIREFTQCDVYIELIERRLFDGEKLRDLANRLGICYSTARSKVTRAKRYLGIASKTSERMAARLRMTSSVLD